jgi:hypothetical protein
MLGMVLWDQSASSIKAQKTLKLEKQSFKDELTKLGQHEWVDFSDGALPPHGKSKAVGKTDFIKTLSDVESLIQESSPDWIYLFSDGGFSAPQALPSLLSDTQKFATIIDPKYKDDISIDRLETDPVWYVRSDSEIRIFLSRNALSTPNQVDLLISLNGQLVSTSQARFDDDQLQTSVSLNIKAERMGSLPLEIRIAEGQGGAIPENDHLLRSCDILRDRVRILRVVGRPNWSSKFIRDMLMEREDVDLIDFHILRAMNDRVLANTDELALIPFPVEELFVENIDSFDLILWQNFDYESYPFFKAEYVRNLQKAVRSGCGLFLLNGALPWSLERAPMSSLAPIQNKGEDSKIIKGRWKVNPSEFIQNPLKERLEQSPEFSMRTFQGQPQRNSTTVLSIGEVPIISTMPMGKGRVLQLATDQLWQWRFSPPKGHRQIYGDLLKQCLLWLQHHPDTERRDFHVQSPAQLHQGLQVTMTEIANRDRQLIWSRAELQSEIAHLIPANERQITIPTPSTVGSYKLRLEDHPPQIISIQGLQGEFHPKNKLVQTKAQLLELGMTEVSSPREIQLDNRESSGKRSTGQPWHDRVWFLPSFVLMALAHWLLINRNIRSFMPS